MESNLRYSKGHTGLRLVGKAIAFSVHAMTWLCLPVRVGKIIAKFCEFLTATGKTANCTNKKIILLVHDLCEMEESSLINVEEFHSTIKVEELIIPGAVEVPLLASNDWCSVKPNETSAPKKGSTDVKQKPVMDITDAVEVTAAYNQIVASSCRSELSERCTCIFIH
ncbi:uncharacterized protein LOC129733993 isoform X4 [Wyeomyia smithii]|uniref:uncharacterized protein LOC129733993 isoform X4 n=1 Tax=Wyeomyia smithii TaxID=174621 RepID=UPI0024681EEE|nr:uncharacterized protein LOC129733993 isoform X4 [Wyeomyia smithii]